MLVLKILKFERNGNLFPGKLKPNVFKKNKYSTEVLCTSLTDYGLWISPF